MPIHTSGGKAPLCPDCAVTMRYIDGAMGAFWGCMRYPRCKRTLPVEEPIIIAEEDDHPETFEEKTQRWIREMWNTIPEVMSPKEIPLYYEDTGEHGDWGDRD